ncbi:nicotinamide phosphoribosyl transferase [Serratia phage 92A1]|nr:nicotinamide phosphoribosyl transferase [Serratia phage 92A1]
MSIIFNTDSYKVTHHNQFPAGTQYTRYYVEARGGYSEYTVQAGINYIISLLEKGITKKQVERMKRLMQAHFGAEYFNYEGWMKLAERSEQGKGLPIGIEAIPEGSVVPVKNALAIVYNTDPEFFWLPGWIETALLRAVWYPTSVATRSRQCKVILHKYLSETSDLSGEAYWMTLGTRLHDFGARGATSEESASIGGLAHLYNFIGTDTIEALILAQDLLGETGAAGISVAAREHSTTTSWGKENEQQAYLNSVKYYGANLYSCVLDSYSFKQAILNLDDIKEQIIEAGGVFIARPDSGDMFENIEFALKHLGEIFGFTVNTKGYKVLGPNVRIIQGDGLDNHEDIKDVCQFVKELGWSIENIAFGMGGGLHQKLDRDTHKFAMKCSAITIDGQHYDVFKSPEDAPWKASKKGNLMTLRKGTEYVTIDTIEQDQAQWLKDGWVNAMKLYYYEGAMPLEDTLQEIRKRTAV